MAFHYYGAKNQMAKHYPRPVYRTIIEPFAGSASYAFYHLKNGGADRAILCEKSAAVFNALMWMKTHTPEEALSYPIPVAGERSSDFFVKMSSASNAALGCSYMTVTPRMANVFPRMMRRISEMIPLMSRIVIVHDSYECLPNVEATWFIDPPYQCRDGHTNGNGYAKGCRSCDIDFASLAGWCMSRSGQVIVCEKEGADWLPFVPFRTVTNTLDVKYGEVVWTRGCDHD